MASNGVAQPDNTPVTVSHNIPNNELRRDNTLDRILDVANEDVEMVVSTHSLSTHI